MTRLTYLLIGLSVSLSAFAQIALKAGMASSPVERLVGKPPSAVSLLYVLFSPFVLFGLFLYFGSALVWLSVLSRVEVSTAYPFVAVGFVLTGLLGWLVFNDSFSTTKIVGTILILAGVVILSRG